MAYLIDTDGTERPALIWLRNYVMGTVLNTNNVASSDHIVVAPNPVRAGSSIQVLGEEEFTSYAVYDLSWRQLSTGTFNGNTLQLSDQLHSGYYLLVLYSKEQTFVKKLIVQ